MKQIDVLVVCTFINKLALILSRIMTDNQWAGLLQDIITMT